MFIVSNIIDSLLEEYNLASKHFLLEEERSIIKYMVAKGKKALTHFSNVLRQMWITLDELPFGFKASLVYTWTCSEYLYRF